MPKTVLSRRNFRDRDLWLYARSFHIAAKTLAATFQPDANPFAAFDACPVVFMYRHAVELHLKAMVLGEGSNFLATKADLLSIHKTHSVSWLAQFVVQIITAVKWEEEFKCESIENLAAFKAVIEELNAVDPGSYVFRLPVSTERQDAIPGQVKLTIRDFARRMDALLELLASTADALAAEWDMRSGAVAIEDDLNGSGFEPTIH
jgi:hypothetical protein